MSTSSNAGAPEGPLYGPTGVTEIGITIRRRRSATLGLVMVANTGVRPIRIEDVGIRNAERVTMLGSELNVLDPNEIPHFASIGFPPRDTQTTPTNTPILSSTALSPNGEPDPTHQLLVGVRLDDNATRGLASDVWVRYRVSGVTYEATYPVALLLCEGTLDECSAQS